MPITETLKADFMSEGFKKLYFEYNDNRACEKNVYTDFCCSSAYTNCSLFSTDPLSVQIQLSMDDFEILAPLKSKAGVYKTCGIYFQIRNLPKELLSKLNNTRLVALCNSSDTKAGLKDINDVLELLVKDLKTLETDGIKISENVRLRGTLVSQTGDNLAVNRLFGMVENFSTTAYYCRVCTASREECLVQIREDISKLRTKEEYTKIMNYIENCNTQNMPIDYKISKGYKRYTLLNDLQYFHILDNISPDVMHDINEGIIPMLLKELFQYCIEQKILTLDQLKNRVSVFNYGSLFKKDVPSELLLGKSNLNQNAAQLYCLAICTPYILWDKQDQLKDIWLCVTTLLQLMQIIYSTTISETHVTLLEKLIAIHLTKFQEKFGVLLKPKQHFLVHYPRTIRTMGPVILMWTMRTESKNKSFVDMARRTNNFKNIYFTLATREQLSNRVVLDNELILSAKRRFHCEANVFKNIYIQKFNNKVSELKILLYVRCNNSYFRKDILVRFQKNFYEIIEIVTLEEDIWFLSHELKLVEPNEFLNSWRIEPFEEEPILIELTAVDLLKSYQTLCIDNMKYIPAATLEIPIVQSNDNLTTTQ